MTFKNTLGNTFTLTIDDPSDDLTEQNIIDAMNLIKEKNIFLPKGYELAQCVSAKVVASDTTEYDLEVVRKCFYGKYICYDCKLGISHCCFNIFIDSHRG